MINYLYFVSVQSQNCIILLDFFSMQNGDKVGSMARVLVQEDREHPAKLEPIKGDKYNILKQNL